MKEFADLLDPKEKKEYLKLLEQVSDMNQKEKDSFMAAQYIISIKTAKNLANIVEIIGKNKNTDSQIKKEIKEIEDTISLGIPGWVKYTRKTKKTKK